MPTNPRLSLATNPIAKGSSPGLQSSDQPTYIVPKLQIHHQQLLYSPLLFNQFQQRRYPPLQSPHLIQVSSA
jgi:hypothetical protein